MKYSRSTRFAKFSQKVSQTPNRVGRNRRIFFHWSKKSAAVKTFPPTSGIKMYGPTYTQAAKEVKCAVCKALVRDATEGAVNSEGRLAALQTGFAALVSQLTQRSTDDEGNAEGNTAGAGAGGFVNASYVMPVLHTACYGLGVDGEVGRCTLTSLDA
jgi:hypothetical protein